MHRGNLQERPFQRALQLRHGTEEIRVDGLRSGLLTKAVLLQVGRVGQPPFFVMARVRLFQAQVFHHLHQLCIGTRRGAGGNHAFHNGQQLDVVEWRVMPLPVVAHRDSMDGDLLGDPLDQRLSLGHVLAQLSLFDQLKLRVHLCTLQPFQLGRAPGPVSHLVIHERTKDDARVVEKRIATIRPKLGFLVHAPTGCAAQCPHDLIRRQPFIGPHAHSWLDDDVEQSFQIRDDCSVFTVGNESTAGQLLPRQTLPYIALFRRHTRHCQGGFTEPTSDGSQRGIGFARTDGPEHEQALLAIAP